MINLNCLKNTNKISIDDITVSIAIRATEINPWVIKRLELLLTYYDPKPKFLIIDFGSQGEYEQKISSICLKHKANYFHIDDQGTFALAKARNIAYEKADTDYIFYTDVDFIGEKDLFAQILKQGNAIGLTSESRAYFQLPIYHLSQKSTSTLSSLTTNDEKSAFLTKIAYLGSQTKFDDYFDFVAPYSNAFLISKTCFNYTGGYCDEFRGHGSEDFEFFIRLQILNRQIPVSKNLDKDFFGPRKDTFFWNKPYCGFRKFIEAGTIQSELAGLKIFHMYHESPRDKGYWTSENDWKREKFNTLVGKFYPEIHNILNVDYLPRKQKALCLFKDKKSWGYFIPLRLYGYKLESLTDDSNDRIFDYLKKVENREFDRLVIFNPYMKSHAGFRVLIEVAKKMSIPVTIIERGALPNSIYYANEVAYGDPDYLSLRKRVENITPLEQIQKYLEQIKTGSYVLEKQESYAQTYTNSILLRTSSLKKIFIPLQLPDDMAVTKFTEGFISYAEFQNQITETAKKYPQILFLIKQHPLSKVKINNENFENIIICDPNANVHCLIDISDLVCVYNSGVGLLSCIHEKPTFNLGNAYYSNTDFLSNHVNSIEESIERFLTSDFHKISREEVEKYIQWLFMEKYSFFTAKSIIKEFRERKSHQYDEISVQSIYLDGVRKNCSSIDCDFDFSEKSYLGHRIDFNNLEVDPPKSSAQQTTKNIKINSTVNQKLNQDTKPIKNTTNIQIKSEPSKSMNLSQFASNVLMKILLDKKRYQKLQSNPTLFFKDSKSSFVKLFSGIYLK